MFLLALAAGSLFLQALPTITEHEQLDELLSSRVPFGFDEDQLRSEDREVLVRAAQFLKEQPNLAATIHGHCDDRGTEEYNLALGDRRARVVASYLQDMGVPSQRLKTVSHGHYEPRSAEHNEDAWAQNRRADFSTSGQLQIRSQSVAAVAAYAPAPQMSPKTAGDTAAAERRLAKTSEPGVRKLPLVGLAIMAVAAPAVLAALPLLASVFYLGPTAATAPASCQEPISVQGGTPRADVSSWCGSGWSSALHRSERPLAAPILAVGLGGALLIAALASTGFVIGAAMVAMSFLGLEP